MTILRFAAFNPVPWRNGGGVTHEALRVPAVGDPFRWRVSVADIASSGPFSDFSGYHRTLVLLRGSGVRLSFDGSGERLLREAGEFVEFDGGCPVRSVLVDGACSDLNLMVAKSLPRPHARVELLTAPRELARHAGTTLIFPIAGTLSLEGGGSQEGGEEECAVLGEWDLAVLPGAAARCIHPAGPAACLVFLATLEDNFG